MNPKDSDLLRSETPAGKPEPVWLMISLGELPLYEEIAKETGYEVEVIGKPGESYITQYMGNEANFGSFGRPSHLFETTMKIQEGQLRIAISKPEDQKDHSPFWNRFKELKNQQREPLNW